MDYVVGSVAALITGNVTPNRPRLARRALTPTKHQPSPNVTPKSGFIDDRSIFLSPSLQKKKAIVKKSPKRIFENPDLDATDNGEGSSKVSSPKADKVKKHLKGELESDSVAIPKSPKSPRKKHNILLDSKSPKKKLNISKQEEGIDENVEISNENTPKKKKRQWNQTFEVTEDVKPEDKENFSNEVTKMAVNLENNGQSPKKKNKKRKSASKSIENIEVEDNMNNPEVVNPININKSVKSPKKKRKTSESQSFSDIENSDENRINIEVPKAAETNQKKKKKKNLKKKKGQNQKLIIVQTANQQTKQLDNILHKSKNRKKSKTNLKTSLDSENKSENEIESDEEETLDTGPMEEHTEVILEKKSKKDKKKNKNKINPNAITEKDSDSEHESDNEIESENEIINKEILDTGPVEESSDEEEEKRKPEKKKHIEETTEEDVKRTLFVGNVKYNKKVKKEIKKIFNKYGQIESIRIRTVPVKDARVTPKLAVIKNELHPDRSTVNVYVKYSDPSSVDEALVENNTVLNDYHLRVTRADTTGDLQDPKCSVFVGNLPFGIEDETLRQKFENCGDIVSVRVIRDRVTNAGKVNLSKNGRSCDKIVKK